MSRFFVCFFLRLPYFNELLNKICRKSNMTEVGGTCKENGQWIWLSNMCDKLLKVTKKMLLESCPGSTSLIICKVQAPVDAKSRCFITQTKLPTNLVICVFANSSIFISKDGLEDQSSSNTPTKSVSKTGQSTSYIQIYVERRRMPPQTL